MQDSTTSSVILKAVQGDSEARDEILREYRPLIHLVIRQQTRRMFQSRFDESDVVQQALIEASEGLPAFRGNSRPEFHRWLLTIVQRNLWSFAQVHLAEKRDVRRECEGHEFDGSLSVVWQHRPSGTRSPESVVVAGESALQLAKALEKLPPDVRRVLELRFMNGQKLREIADEQNASVGQIAGLLRRGLWLLQEHLPPDLRSRLWGK